MDLPAVIEWAEYFLCSYFVFQSLRSKSYFVLVVVLLSVD